MSQNPPQTLSVKRKRNDAPVDALYLEPSVKKQRSQLLPKAPGFVFRRLTKPNDTPQQPAAPEPPTPTVERRFHLDATAKAQGKRVFAEAKTRTQGHNAARAAHLHAPTPDGPPKEPSRAQKRPGAGSALHPTAKSAAAQKARATEPTAQDVRELEALSKQVEKEDNLFIPLPSPSKHKPKPPAQRFAQRHPEKAAELAAQDDNHGDAMDIDTEEYVYDTYVREALVPDADGKLPEPTGTVGFLVIGEEDEDWWNGDDESDKEFDTDDEDENAEDYYANDYPEDELDEDDEYDRDLYQKKYRHGSDDEEYNLDQDDDVIGSGEDEDDLHFKMTVPKAQRPGYWGAVGEA
ncbi:hypothetical protein HBI56_174270 [Parastagonospora nodorum]|nr:hypothetical protein HBH51_236860 [Parastagonospora nodorum]KAH3993371.1 hypothetical protein HBI10_201550 [Parastagonospora nodorum]KAH4011773.1 hypothetical protein HBI13_196700 [Parastagonospora nodorum]KAH4024811.1 hypothetical protein HBI09_158790 [Parastagonospora nodorum]KAH4118216.1 hypothetical protein HBH47_143460 [Parastagonospora nodorum]